MKIIMSEKEFNEIKRGIKESKSHNAVKAFNKVFTGENNYGIKGAKDVIDNTYIISIPDKISVPLAKAMVTNVPEIMPLVTSPFSLSKANIYISCAKKIFKDMCDALHK